MGTLTGRAAAITGPHDQGRRHTLRMPAAADLLQTAINVFAKRRRAFAREIDVRDSAAVARGTRELVEVQNVRANASIGLGGEQREPSFRDVVEVNLFGVRNTVHAADPLMIAQGRGDAIVLTSSTHCLTGRDGSGDAGARPTTPANTAWSASCAR